MNIFVVVPNWNGADFLQQSVDSLLLQSQECSIIIVENGSVDESDQILASYGNKITVLKQAKNLGFAGGVNVGIRHALQNGADYVALFNNDAVADKLWLKNLTRAAKANNAGITTCKFLHMDDNRLDSTGDFYTIYGLPFPRGRGEVDKKQYDTSLNVFGGTGGASLYNAKMLKEIGLFDEDFFAYFEDVDLSFRAQLAGYKAIYVPTAIAYHEIGGTSSKVSGFTTYQTAKNFWYVYTKNMPLALYVKYLPLASYWYLRMFVSRILRGGSIAFIKGWVKSLVVTPTKLRQRWVIQKSRKVSVDYINSIIYPGRPPKI